MKVEIYRINRQEPSAYGPGWTYYEFTWRVEGRALSELTAVCILMKLWPGSDRVRMVSRRHTYPLGQFGTGMIVTCHIREFLP
jgi:hypothetical protein